MRLLILLPVVAFFASSLLPRLSAAPPDFDQYEILDMPSYRGNYVRLTVGLDGRVLLACSQTKTDGFLWVLDKDGNSLGSTENMGNYMHNAFSNQEHVVALALAHVNHAVLFFKPDLTELHRYDEYTQQNKGETGYDNPASVWAGKSGKFYAYDLYGHQIVVYSADGRPDRTIPLSGEEYTANAGTPGVLFPDEQNQRFVLFSKTAIIAFDEQGRQTSFKIRFLPGPVTLGDNGSFYHYDPKSSTLEELSPEGELLSSVVLPVPPLSDSDIDHPWWWSVAVHQDEIFLRRGHPYVLFERFNLKDGSLIKTVETKFQKTEPPPP